MARLTPVAVDGYIIRFESDDAIEIADRFVEFTFCVPSHASAEVGTNHTPDRGGWIH